MSGGYWVYVNEPNDKALVHRGDCSFCRDGEGMQDEKLASNGKWLGPFDRRVAVRTAEVQGKKTQRWCGHCARRLNIPAEF